jgi:hypothetical protein
MYVFVNKSGTDLTPHTIINDISTARDVLKPFDTFHYFPAPGENSVKLQFKSKHMMIYKILLKPDKK